jgi:hypothetical protein
MVRNRQAKALSEEKHADMESGTYGTVAEQRKQVI